ncbi:MAG: Na+/H+ antiporter NhaA [Cutibacterium avidum]|nr:Na+/H+ antiporter NhaA [Cutibacterium avidum]
MTDSHKNKRPHMSILRPVTGPNALHLSDIFRNETTGGMLMLAATVAALLWANFGQHSYHFFRELTVGPLTIEGWAADGLLTIFFFIAGLELKREFVEGSLSRPADALVPIVAAVCGMVFPAGIYTLFNLLSAEGHPAGWAIPMATDIAFALAVLAIVGSGLPQAVRAFLLTLAIADDLGSIIVIAVFFSNGIDIWWLLGAIVCISLWGVMQHFHVDNGWWYVPIFIVGWWCMLHSGVHATIAGVAFGLLTRTEEDVLDDPVDRWQHKVEPWSAGAVVPFFALMSAGVQVNKETFLGLWAHPISLGIICGLIGGKVIGITLGSWLTARFTSAELGRGVVWRDIIAVAMLAGIGFTVSMLMTDLSFPKNHGFADEAKASVLVASFLAAILGGALLHHRGKRHSLWEEKHPHEVPVAAGTSNNAD